MRLGETNYLVFLQAEKMLRKPSLTALKARMQISYVEKPSQTQNHPSGIILEGDVLEIIMKIGTEQT